MKSLRGQLLFFWVLLFGMCAALAVVMLTLYRSSAGAQVAAGRGATEQSCRAIAARYAKSAGPPAPAKPQVDLLQVLLQLVLIETPHVEGGVWQAAGGQLAYAYPTYEGSGVKRDVPAAEQPLIVEMAQLAARTQQPQTDVVRGSREALIVSACPLAAPGNDLAAWTMTRTNGGALAAQDSLRTGLGVLLLLVLASGLWLGFILLRGLRHVQRLENRLVRAEAEAAADGGAMPELPRTGVRELDRIVDGFNRYRLRFEEARAHLRAAAQQRSRDQRLAALGRMTGGIAHEIRNPIATMRLKAENALAATPERQGAALQAIVGQIDRLDGLVQSLLALVQPVTLAPVEVVLHRWLDERVAAVAPKADAAGVQVTLRHDAPANAVFDPVHLARAVDNLLDNAVRHAPRGGHVVLAALLAQPNLLAIRVDDDGAGVPASLQASLFEPFATGRADGTGLGLALAREVALAHSGELRHVPLEAGTRFELELPWHIC
ncbi:HAMP domain-containing sensor histidine kinase [Variovorax sp. J22G73]|jgi:signal transduction histidine kinase|uniref:sensor histidine kinase n=1 Tax=unclassified Variovorax TaxID=663243 RepID=UPI000D5F0AA0|nr:MULTISPECIES: HAMP domain-containing sensor histidine kinase [unclassified Variovorax]MDM0010433.1 HAMP domain-containing sensor histidine kinase [Variovorax sp. J22R203]MDM0102829.1 HAMP domain-containing sensor histidine kinase [Variovorax sp. J22G73]